MSESKNELLWASGLFEGEGWISIQAFTPQVGIQSTDKDVLERFQAAIGLGNIYHRKTRIYDYEKIHTRKEQWAWRVSGFEKSQAVIAMLWFGLGSRRRARAKEVLGVANSAAFKRIVRKSRVPTITVCGEVQQYWKGCRCDKCKQANTLYTEELRDRRYQESPRINRTNNRKTPE